MLEVDQIETYYGQARAVSGVSLRVSRGKIVCLLGANGAGKTTIIRTICGLTPARRGQVRFEGRRIDGLEPEEIVMAGISCVPEGRSVFPQMTVTENLEMGAFAVRDPAVYRRRLQWVRHLFPILSSREAQKAATLSGGEQQMLALARALMAGPRLLIVDELSLGLAPRVVDQLLEVLPVAVAEGTSILLVEQNAYRALAAADYGYVLSMGQVVMEGPAGELLQNRGIRDTYLGRVQHPNVHHG